MSIVLPIEEDDRYRIIVASAGQTELAITFPWQDGHDIALFRWIDEAWIEIPRGSYGLAGAGQPGGGALTLSNQAAAGDRFLIVGDAVLDRLSSIVADGRFKSRLTDDEFDRNRIIQQEQARDIARAVKVGFGDPLQDLPRSDGVSLIGWGADGQLVNRHTEGVSAAIAEAAADRAEDAADRAEAAVEAVSWPVSYKPQALARADRDQASANVGARIRYATLTELAGATVPAGVTEVEIIEHSTGTGGRAIWAFSPFNPDVTALAKVQDAAGKWFVLQPRDGVITAEMLGARSGIVLDANTRTIVNGLSTTRTVAHVKLLDRTVRRFMRIGVWADVAWSIAGGLVTFVPSFAIRAEQYDAALWIKGQYDAAASRVSALGRLALTAELNTALSIDAAGNAARLQAAIDHAQLTGARLELTSPHDYPVAATLRARLPITITGHRGQTRILAVNTMPFNDPVFQSGGPGALARNVWLRGIVFDGNIRRLSGSAGSTTGAPSGTVVSFCHQHGGGAEHCEAYDGRKHCFDITGSSYPSSGTPGVVAAQITEMSDRVVIRDCIAEGAGDDCFTTHSARFSGFENCAGGLNTGGDTNNSIAFEFDDGTEDCWGQNLRAYYSGCALQVKGHNAGRPARRVFVDGVSGWKTNSGIMIFHTDFGNSYPRSPLADGVIVRNAVIRHPLAWIEAEAIKVGLRHYGYSGVSVQAKFIQEGADPDYYNRGEPGDPDFVPTQGVVGIYREASHSSYEIEIKGFPEVMYGVNITGSTDGPLVFSRYITSGGPLTAFRKASSLGGIALVSSFMITRTGGGGTGILGNGVNLRVGKGWVDGYDTPVSGSIPYP